MRLLISILCAAGILSAESADEIMLKVGRNQDSAVAARAQFVYNQNLLIRMKRANGKLAREETRDYTVTPAADGVKRELVHLIGKVQNGKKTIDYTKADFKYKGVDVDGDLVNSFADEFGLDKESKDGVNHDLFPLRSQVQPQYSFKLIGVEKWHDTEAFHIEFGPKEKQNGHADNDDDRCWAGDAFVDVIEYQPLMVSTHFTCKIPVLVKTMLGTNLQQMGFKVTYKKVADGVWFPETYGGEFKFRAVFMYARTVGIGLRNTEYRRARIDTAINYDLQ